MMSRHASSVCARLVIDGSPRLLNPRARAREKTLKNSPGFRQGTLTAGHRLSRPAPSAGEIFVWSGVLDMTRSPL
jgi:hypothetical protein